MNDLFEELTTGEKLKLEDLEDIVKTGLEKGLDAIEALEQIRAERLYKGTHTNFAAYCRERWGMTKDRFFQLRTAASVCEELKKNPENSESMFSEINARQACELAKAPAEQRAGIIQAVAATGKVTAEKIKEEVKRVMGGAGTADAAAAAEADDMDANDTSDADDSQDFGRDFLPFAPFAPQKSALEELREIEEDEAEIIGQAQHDEDRAYYQQSVRQIWKGLMSLRRIGPAAEQYIEAAESLIRGLCDAGNCALPKGVEAA